MTEQHPITPPPELVQQWHHGWKQLSRDKLTDFPEYMATQAARWGADQELEACCEWLEDADLDDSQKVSWVKLRLARRPKPPSLKELAMQAWCRFQASDHTTADEMMSDFATIRRALEQLDD
jgi:hypothetical protein